MTAGDCLRAGSGTVSLTAVERDRLENPLSDIAVDSVGTRRAGPSTSRVDARGTLGALLPATLGHYRIVRPIGAGGMGEVFLAEDEKLGRQVALKVLAHALAADPERRGRFEREARAVAALNHPNIITIYSVEEQDGVLFLTMELVEGKTLTELIPPQGMSLEQLLHVGDSAGRRGRRGAPARHHASRPEARERDGHRRGPA